MCRVLYVAIYYYLVLVQIIAVSREELEAAQRWTGAGVVALLREHRM